MTRVALISRITAFFAFMAATYTSTVAFAADKDGKSAGMPQLNFENWPAQILWAAAALLLMFWLLNKKILPRIAGALEDRHNAIANDLDRAAELKLKAEEAQEGYETALAGARSRATEIADKTRAEISETVEAETAHAEADIAARSAEGEQRIGQVRSEAAASAKTIATDTATQILEKLAPGMGDPSRVGAAVDRVLAARPGA